MSFQSEDLVNFVGTHPAKIALKKKSCLSVSELFFF